MEFAAAAISITSVAARTSSKLWRLTGTWRDAPTDLHYLRDELTQTEIFFREIQQNLDTAQLTGPSQSPRRELDGLIKNGINVLKRIEVIADEFLAQDDGAEKQTDRQAPEELGKRRKFLWLRRLHKIVRWRKDLRVIRTSICQFMISHNAYATKPAPLTIHSWCIC